MQTESFHSHTVRCRHASGTEREYIENAIKAGMTKLGFSDHSPYVFEDGYYSGHRMYPEEFKGYCDTLTALKAEYAGKIELHIGLEVEYYPKFFDKFLKLIEGSPVEYMILGQHFPENEMGQKGNGAPTDDEERLKLYVRQTDEAMATGKFCCFAHPDLINFTGDRAVYRRHMTKLCENALKYEMPLEINLLGIRTNRSYPNPEFWKIVGEVGNDVVCGSDAHEANVVQDQPSYDKALEMVDRFGLKLHEASYILRRHTL